ncbi:MAG: carbohydrate ABC transporter permease [Lachnospiraceae bacterium]|nr:carbohydrate ABC transporter permease [Lachnospiraceae bacterium]
MFTKQEKIFQVISHIVLAILAINALLPMILLLMSSITDDNTLIKEGYKFIPKKFSLYAYEYVFKTGPAVPKAYLISVILTISGVVLSLAITTPMAYALSKKYVLGRGFMNFYVFFTMLFNGGLVPTYMNYVNVIGIKNTFMALLLPGLVTNGMYIMLMKSYFVTSIPDEIMEAARIDGASEFKVFYTIAIPLAKPIITTIGLFSGIGYWNDWQNGYVYITKRTDLYSIQNLLNRMVQNIQYLSANSQNVANADIGLASIPTVAVRMSMAVLGILPMLIAYPFAQKAFVKGITLGGVKG